MILKSVPPRDKAACAASDQETIMTAPEASNCYICNKESKALTRRHFYESDDEDEYSLCSKCNEHMMYLVGRRNDPPCDGSSDSKSQDQEDFYDSDETCVEDEVCPEDERDDIDTSESTNSDELNELLEALNNEWRMEDGVEIDEKFDLYDHFGISDSLSSSEQEGALEAAMGSS